MSDPEIRTDSIVGADVSVAISDIESLEVRRLSAGRTAGLSAGVGAGVVLGMILAGSLAIALVVAQLGG